MYLPMFKALQQERDGDGADRRAGADRPRRGRAGRRAVPALVPAGAARGGLEHVRAPGDRRAGERVEHPPRGGVPWPEARSATQARRPRRRPPPAARSSDWPRYATRRVRARAGAPRLDRQGPPRPLAKKAASRVVESSMSIPTVAACAGLDPRGSFRRPRGSGGARRGCGRRARPSAARTRSRAQAGLEQERPQHGPDRSYSSSSRPTNRSTTFLERDALGRIGVELLGPRRFAREVHSPPRYARSAFLVREARVEDPSTRPPARRCRRPSPRRSPLREQLLRGADDPVERGRARRRCGAAEVSSRSRLDLRDEDELPDVLARVETAVRLGGLLKRQEPGRFAASPRPPRARRARRPPRLQRLRGRAHVDAHERARLGESSSSGTSPPSACARSGGWASGPDTRPCSRTRRRVRRSGRPRGCGGTRPRRPRRRPRRRRRRSGCGRPRPSLAAVVDRVRDPFLGERGVLDPDAVA